MQSKHVIPCGGLKLSGAAVKGGAVLPLTLWAGKRSNVTLKVEDLHKGLFKNMPAAFEDLLEIATYVYCADQATSRGAKDVDSFGGRWRRQLEFHIPVRAAEFWNTPEVGRVLRETLGFLSEDDFDFNFLPATHAPAMDQYFPNFDAGGAVDGIERVVLFSGGLDSLAGAVEESVVHKRRVMLVTHRPTSKLNTIQRNVETLLAAKAGAFKPTHLHVRVWKDSDLNRNYTQRTRSFLYAAVGATVSKMLGLDALRFYENGVVSMNLPVSAQVVGTRATRTTHPRVLAGFGQLLTAVAGSAFRVENDFIWDTKADVIKRIVKASCADLIGASVSCAHVYELSHKYPHCGTCSQCIDRRIGLVAAGAESHDPAGNYRSDVFTGGRSTREDRMMVASFVERANQLAKLRDVADMISRYPDVVRALGYLPGKPVAVGERVLELHRHHAAEVNAAIETEIARNAKALRERTLPRDCLLSLTYDRGAATVAASAAKHESEKRQEVRWEKEDESSDTYRLWKGHKVWTVVFQGRRESLLDERAVTLVEHLLKHPPDEPIHATELEARVDGSPVIDGFAGIERGAGGGEGEPALGGVVQEAAGRKLMGGMGKILKAELAELRATSKDETLPESEREKAKGELQELLSAKGRGGKVIDGAAQSADRVRKAIKRFIADLKRAEVAKGKPNAVLRDFAGHLEQYMWLPSVGGRGRVGASGRPGCFTYEPPPDVVWTD